MQQQQCPTIICSISKQADKTHTQKEGERKSFQIISLILSICHAMQCIVVCREHRTPQSESVGHLCAFIANNRSLCRKTCGLFWPISHANHPSASCLMLFESPLISFSSLFLLHICVNVTQSENASLQIKYFFFIFWMIRRYALNAWAVLLVCMQFILVTARYFSYGSVRLSICAAT